MDTENCINSKVKKFRFNSIRARSRPNFSQRVTREFSLSKGMAKSPPSKPREIIPRRGKESRVLKSRPPGRETRENKPRCPARCSTSRFFNYSNCRRELINPISSLTHRYGNFLPCTEETGGTLIVE